MNKLDLGAVTAYAMAVEKGYEGTEEEFAALQAESGNNAVRAEAGADRAQQVLDSIPLDFQEVSQGVATLTEDISGYVENEYSGADAGSDIFSSYATTGTMRFCGNKSEVSGRLESVTANVGMGANNQIATVYIYTQDGGIFRKSASFEIVLTHGVKTYKNGADFVLDDVIPAGSIIGLHADTSNQVLAYGVDGTKGYNIADVGAEYFSATPNANYNHGIGMSIRTKPVLEKTVELEGALEETNAGLLKAQKDVEKLKQAEKILVSETSHTVLYYVDADTIVAKIKWTALTVNTGIRLCRDADSTVAASRQDFILPYTGKMGFYKTVGSAYNDTTKTVVAEKDIGIPMIVGREYLIESIREKGNIATLRITDCLTMETAEITSKDVNVGAGWGKRYLIHGGTEVVAQHYISTQPYNAKVMVLGDSFIEGNSIWANKDGRWCALLRDALDGDVFINGQGGAGSGSVLNWLDDYLCDLCNPKYCILHVGVNDGNLAAYTANMTEIIARLKERGVIPVLVKIPPTTGSNSSPIWKDINAWVESSGELYLDECTILTLDYDGATQNAALFNADLIHPNLEGHEKIFNRIKCDLPILFHLQG